MEGHIYCTHESPLHSSIEKKLITDTIEQQQTISSREGEDIKEKKENAHRGSNPVRRRRKRKRRKAKDKSPRSCYEI
ncbi:hypothetical protein TNCV_3832341 [Trichonephila clavipes]|nr:hypothetical protein TNCV_3832341 [Trichonephila clavipes]